METNHDGLTKEEDAQVYLRSSKELFESVDKDGDGFIGANELRNYLIGSPLLTKCSGIGRPKKKS